MLRRSLVLVVVLALAGNAFGGAQAYTEYKGVEGGDWSLASNWSAIGSGAGTWTGQTLAPLQLDPMGGPQGAYFGKAGFKNSRANASPGIYSGTTVGVDQIVIGSGGAVGSPAIGGHLNVDGGTVNVSEYVNIGNNNTTAVPETGVLNMNSGVINTGARIPAEGRFIVGLKGDGTLNMNGGTINLTSFLTIADGAFATTKGVVNLNGGLISATDLKMANGVLGSASMIVKDGILELHNATDLTGKIQGWIDNAWIRGYAGYEVYTAFDSGVTTVWAEAIPEPATMSLLGLGVLGLLRRNKK